jgi:hypothetical protein
MLQICELVSVINTAFSLFFLTHTLLSQTCQVLELYFLPRHTTQSEAFKASVSCSCSLFGEFRPRSKIQCVPVINHKTCFPLTPKSIFTTVSSYKGFNIFTRLSTTLLLLFPHITSKLQVF